MPLLFVCEDNGWGISVPTPAGWVATSLSSRPGLRYERRRRHRPGRRVRRRRGARRVGAHDGQAGGAAPAHGPLRRTRRHRRGDGVPHSRPASAPTSTAIRCWPPPACSSSTVGRRPTPSSSATSTAARPCATDGRRARRPPPVGDGERGDGTAVAAPAGRRRRAGGVVAATPDAGSRSSVASPRTAARSRWPSRSTARSATCSPPIPRCSCSARTSAPRAACTASPEGLQRRAGGCRVFDTLLDEQSILGLALGAGLSGLRADPRDPVPRLPAQRRGPAARRGGQPVVLLQRAVPQPAGRAHRRLRLPEGVRRALPQRQRRRRAARHPRARDRLAGPCRPTRRRCCARASPPPWPTAR